MPFASWKWIAAILSFALNVTQAMAQTEPPRLGEAVVTGFSGLDITFDGQVLTRRIAPDGPVARIIDLRSPGLVPSGQHWLSAPQRPLVAARDVGQVWGVALGEGQTPEIYLAASSAYGVYLAPDGVTWAEGQWGPEGSPASIWRLPARDGKPAEMLADLSTGRAGLGAGLGDLAFDPYHRLLFVSDLETGLIHAIDPATGAVADSFDHGIEALSGYLDLETGAAVAQETIAYEPPVADQDCAAAARVLTRCLGYAPPARRVWGLALRRDDTDGEIRLFYGQGDGESGLAVWSVALTADGRFDRLSAAKVFEVPVSAEAADVFALSNLGFAQQGPQDTLLVSRFRGGDDFAPGRSWPAFDTVEPQVWRLKADGRWLPDSVDDVTAPLGANLAGSSAFGPDPDDVALAATEAFAWFTGNHLCSMALPCTDMASGRADDVSEVHGLTGLALPFGAPDGLRRDLAIDLDINLAPDGSVITDELTRRNPGMVGDIVVHTGYPEGAADMVVAALPDPWLIPSAAGGSPAAGSGSGVAAGAGAGLPTAASAQRDLALTKTAAAECVSTMPCPFRITIHNTGDLPFDGTLGFVDIMPAGWRKAATLADWDCILTAFGGDRFACRRATVLLPGQSVSFDSALWPPQDADGIALNCAEIDWSKTEADDGPDNDRACAQIAVRSSSPAQGVDLSLSKTLRNAPLTGPFASAKGGCATGAFCPFTFDIRISNSGTAPYDGPVRFNDLLPPGWVFAGGPGLGACELHGAFLECEIPGDAPLAPGEDRVAALVLQAPPEANPTSFVTRNCAALAWTGAGDGNPANDSDCAEVTVSITDAQDPALTALNIAKTGDATCHFVDGCTFTIWVHNGSDRDFSGVVTLDDHWLPGWTLAAAPQGWACTQPAAATWNCSGPLAVAAGATVTSTWRFDPPPGFSPTVTPVPAQNCVALLGRTACFTTLMEIGRGEPPAQAPAAAGPPGQGPATTPPASPPGGVAAGSPGLATPGWTVGTLPPTGFTFPWGNLAGLPPATPKDAEPADTADRTDLPPGVRIEKIVAGACEPGGRCDFIINVRGTSETAYKDQVIIEDYLPRGWTFAGGGTQGLWSCKDGQEGRVCIYDFAENKQFKAMTEGLTKNDVIGFGLQLNVPDTQPAGTVQNCVRAFVTPGARATEEQKAGLESCATIIIGHAPRLEITKRFRDKYCTHDCPFDVVITNTGKGVFHGPLHLSEYFPAQSKLDFNPADVLTTLAMKDGKPLTCIGYPNMYKGATPGGDTSATVDCLGIVTIPAGERITLSFDAVARSLWTDPEADHGFENCISLTLFDPKSTRLDVFERTAFVRGLLRSEGYTDTVTSYTENNDRLTAAEKAALAQFRTDRGIGGDADDLQPVIDAMMPRIRDKAFDDPKTSRNSNGTATLTACDTAYALPQVSISKTGITDYTSNKDFACYAGGYCIYTIEITSNANNFIADDVTVFDKLPHSGWTLASYAPQGANGWLCSRAMNDQIVCHHGPVDLPRGQSLKLTLDLKGYPPQNFPREQQVVNCAQFYFNSDLAPEKLAELGYYSCYRQWMLVSDLAGYRTSMDGTGSCIPPNCSFVRAQIEPDADTRRIPNRWSMEDTGVCLPPECPVADVSDAMPPLSEDPLTLTLDLPEQARMGPPEVTSNARLCPGSNWDCTTLNNQVICEAARCVMQPGDRVSVRLNGKLAPELTAPPPEPQTRRTCATVEWTPTRAAGGIEQSVGRQSDRDCLVTQIAAAPKEFDLALRKSVVGSCSKQRDCRFQISVGSAAEQPVKGPVVIRDVLSKPGAQLGQVYGDATCSQSGQTITCISKDGPLASGKPLSFSMDLRLPYSTGAEMLSNCAELALVDPTDTAPLARDEVRMVQDLLSSLGHDPGPSDGISGPRTMAAANAARAAEGLSPIQTLDRAFLAQLLGIAPEQSDSKTGNNRACVTVSLPSCPSGYSVSTRTGDCYCPSSKVVVNGRCVTPDPAPRVTNPEPRSPTPTPAPATRPEPVPTPVPTPQKPVTGVIIDEFKPLKVPIPVIPQVPTCPQDQVFSTEAGRCIVKPGTVVPIVPLVIPNLKVIPLTCPPGQEISPKTGTCVLSGVKID